MALIPTTFLRPLQIFTRVMQWSSAVIVMGLTSFFINRGPRGQHITYQEVIATISIAFFIPAFISPFVPSVIAKFVFMIDVIFSYLWLTSFIFAAQDYNWHQCLLNAPPGVGCSKKRANEAFIFLTFIFTFFGMLLELLSLWSYREDRTSPEREKHGPAAVSGATNGAANGAANGATNGAANGAPAAAGAGSAPATSTV